MRTVILILATFVLTSIQNSCSHDRKNDDQSVSSIKKENNNPQLKKHSGGYTIEIKGIQSIKEVEAYALSENEKAKWMWIENDGRGGAIVKSTKSGTWTATETKISIYIQGNSGVITEDYVLENGIFTNTLNNNRYLKRTE